VAIRWGAVIGQARSCATEGASLAELPAVSPGWTVRVNTTTRFDEGFLLCLGCAFHIAAGSRRRGRRGPFDGARRRGGVGSSALAAAARRALY
jgi:alpha-D-ribose 1-methylphosphonate 5-triphosphate synthase subunit PhnI